MSDSSQQPFVRRVAVIDPVALAQPGNYADAFETDWPETDPQPPEAWVRAGLGRVPQAVKRIVGLLGMVRKSSDVLDGWRIVESGPDVVHLERSLSLLHVVLVGRSEPGRRRLTTVLHYRRPVLARVVWLLVGVAHRRTAPRILTSTPSTVEN